MNFTHTYRRALKSYALLLAAGAISIASSHAQEAPTITSISVNEAGRIVIEFDGTAGEYLLLSNDDLTATESWGTLCRLTSNGGSSTVTEPIDAETGQKFFRIQTIYSPDDSALTSTLAAEFDSQLQTNSSQYSYVQSMFGLSAVFNEATFISDTVSLSSAHVQDRIYTSIIGGLTLLAEYILDITTFTTQPTEAALVEAILLDLSDGDIDGKIANGDNIEIGTTGVDLPDILIDEEFLEAYSDLKVGVQGIYNVIIATNPSGGFTVSVPANWGSFYWDSADWQ